MLSDPAPPSSVAGGREGHHSHPVLDEETGAPGGEATYWPVIRDGDTRAHREDVFPTGSRGPLSVKLLQVRGRASEPTLPRAWGMTVALKGSGMVTFWQGQLLGD